MPNKNKQSSNYVMKTFPGVGLREMDVLLQNYIKEWRGIFGKIPAIKTQQHNKDISERSDIRMES